MDASVARTRLPRDDRMEQTLEVAHGLFAARGYADVTMDEVAAAVGVTKPLLYNYFGNKEQLYLACMERGRRRARDASVGAVGRRDQTPGDALRAGVHAFFAFLDTDRAAWRVLFDETLPQRRRDRRSASPSTARSIVALVAARCSPQLPERQARRRQRRGRGRSPPPCSAPPRRWPAGGCAPARSPPTTPPSS